jgi:peptidoglycan hydrolase-like protein with peptidoglycan-binding domain
MDSDSSWGITAKGRKDLGLFLKTLRIFDVQQTLARLGYGVEISGELDTLTRAGIRAFERWHGLPETGDPNAPELRVAIDYVDKLTLNTFALPQLSVLTSLWTGDGAVVHATGTWAPFNPARNTSEIWCYRSKMMCHESSVYLHYGELHVETLDYDVERWNEE